MNTTIDNDLPYNITYPSLYTDETNQNNQPNETNQNNQTNETNQTNENTTETEEMKEDSDNEYSNGRNNDTLELNNRAHINNDALLDHLHVFKRELYKQYVQNDNMHEPDDLGGMYTYHSLLLECIAYWIGLLDDTTKKMPEFEMNTILKSEVQSIKTLILELNKSHSSRPLAYNTLSKISIEDKFLLTQAK